MPFNFQLQTSYKKTVMNDSIKTTLAFIGGALIGTTLGILLAPEKGSDTRKKILSKAKGLADDMTEAAKEKYQDLMHRKDELLDEAEEALADGKSDSRSNSKQYA
jgi:gas vesicle protein